MNPINAIAATPQFRAGFNTVTLTDCCATTSAEGQAGATGGTFGMHSAVWKSTGASGAPSSRRRVDGVEVDATIPTRFLLLRFSDPMTADDFVAKL